MNIVFRKKLEREPIVDNPNFLQSDYPTDYPTSDIRPSCIVHTIRRIVQAWKLHTDILFLEGIS